MDRLVQQNTQKHMLRRILCVGCLHMLLRPSSLALPTNAGSPPQPEMFLPVTKSPRVVPLFLICSWSTIELSAHTDLGNTSRNQISELHIYHIWWNITNLFSHLIHMIVTISVPISSSQDL